MTVTAMVGLPFATAGLVIVNNCPPSVAVEEAARLNVACVAVVCRLLNVKPVFDGAVTCAPCRPLPVI